MEEGGVKYTFLSLDSKFPGGEDLISIACFSCETQKKQALFFFRVCPPKGCSWSHKFLAESVEHGDKNGRVTKAMHKECRAFPVEIGSRFLWLESVDYFGTTDYFSGRKKT